MNEYIILIKLFLYLLDHIIPFLQLLEAEDHYEAECKELTGQQEALDSIVRMLELKHKNSLDHASRLEERENELKKVCKINILFAVVYTQRNKLPACNLYNTLSLLFLCNINYIVGAYGLSKNIFFIRCLTYAKQTCCWVMRFSTNSDQHGVSVISCKAFFIHFLTSTSLSRLSGFLWLQMMESLDGQI